MVEFGCTEWEAQPWSDPVDQCDGQSNNARSRNLQGQNHYQPQFRRTSYRAGYAYSGVKGGHRDGSPGWVGVFSARIDKEGACCSMRRERQQTHASHWILCWAEVILVE
jgi:hypothetical protein